MSEQEKEAALVFAQSKPTEWESFKEQWFKNHPLFTSTSVLDATNYVESIGTETDNSEIGDKKRKAKKSSEP